MEPLGSWPLPTCHFVMASPIAFTFFGTDTDHRPCYRLEWLVPTLALLDLAIAERIDRSLSTI